MKSGNTEAGAWKGGGCETAGWANMPSRARCLKDMRPFCGHTHHFFYTGAYLYYVSSLTTANGKADFEQICLIHVVLMLLPLCVLPGPDCVRSNVIATDLDSTAYSTYAERMQDGTPMVLASYAPPIRASPAQDEIPMARALEECPESRLLP